MKAIKELVCNMREELEDAEKYAKAAMQYKTEDPRLGDMYATLARAELDHCTIQHDHAVRLIDDYRKDHTPPEAMMAIWDWEHEQMIDHKARITVMLNMYKN